MTQRLYYHDAFLHEFEAEVCEVVPASGAESRAGVVKRTLAALGGRGGDAKDFAQGGLPADADTEAALAHALAGLSG